MRNPKAQKSGPITHEATSTREAESGSRVARDTGKVAVSGTKKRTRPKVVTEEKGGTANTEWRNTVGERKEVAAKSKLETLVGELAPEEKISVKEDNLARGGATKSLKRLSSKLSGIYQLNPSRYKLVFLRRKGAYSESFLYKRKQLNWESAQICMCGCELVRTCMIDRNFKLYVCNWYFRRYAMLDGNDVCMIYDKINMHILIVFTTTWKLHTSKLGFRKVLKHVCECMRCSKICNSTARTRSSVTYCVL